MSEDDTPASEDLLARPLLPVATPDDARETYEQLRSYLLGRDAVPLVVHVAEKHDASAVVFRSRGDSRWVTSSAS